MNELPKINSDLPLQAKDAIDHDRLERQGFAAAAVAALQRVSSTDGFVLSIEGAWGSGKTSTLSMMEQLLRPEEKEGAIIVHFNPWLVGDRDSLLRQFLNSVATAVNLKDPTESAKKVSKELLNYADVFDFVKWVPGAEPWASLVKGVITSAGKAAGGVADQKGGNRDIEGQKERLERALAQLETRIYVFIDDIDRLFPIEVFEMVRIIKSIGQLPNVGYVVAWDPEYIRRALKAANVPQAANYVDKIVQVRLPLPAISSRARLQLLNDGLESLPAAAMSNYFSKQEERLQSLYFHGLRELLEQPRDVTRVMNTLSVIEPGLRGEIVLADILGLACLIVLAPRVHTELRRTPELFTGKFESTMDEKNRLKWHKAKMDRLFEKSSNPGAVRRLVHHLFPVVAKASDRYSFGAAIDVQGHIAAPSRLNIALSMVIGATDVSLVDARNYIFRPTSRIGIESKLTAANCMGFLDMLGSVAKTVSKGEVTDLKDLCLAVSRLVDKETLQEYKNELQIFSISPSLLAVDAIENLTKANKTLSISDVAFAIACDSDSLTVAAEIVGNNSVADPEGGSIAYDLSRHKNAAARFAKNTGIAIVAGELWSKSNPSRVLWTMMNLDPIYARRTFLKLKKEDPSLDKFALSFLKHSVSSSGGQSYRLPQDRSVENMINLVKFSAHARKRLNDASVDYPVRAAWRSVLEGKALYGFDGSDARL